MKRLSFVLGLVAILSVAGCSSNNDNAAGADAEHTITVSNSVEEDTALNKGVMKFKEIVEEESDGKISVEVFPNGELYDSEREATEAVQAGNIEAASPATAPLTNFVDEFMVLDFLFAFEDIDDANESLDGELGDLLNEKLEENQLKGIGWGSAGMTQMTNSKGPIESVEDLKGLKIRTMENDVHLDSLEALGANPQPYAFGELYSALQQNIFDGMQTTAQLIESSNIYEVQDYITVMDHSFTAESLIMNKEFFDSLPDDLQTVVEDAGEEFTKYEREISQEYDDEAMDLFNEELEVNELSEEVKEEMAEKVQPVREEYEEKLDPEIVELIEE